MIKYLGSKRTLVPALGAIATAVGADTAVDLFTGTTRVAQEFKRRGIEVTAVDLATYSEVLARCFIATDATTVDPAELSEALDDLSSTPGRRGYVTRTFCEESRYFQPANGERIDAIRDRIEERYRDSALYPVLLSALLLAADRVDSTTGLQMAYLKKWSPRSHRPLELRAPELLPGPGTAIRGDAMALVTNCPRSTWSTSTRRTTNTATSPTTTWGDPGPLGRTRPLRGRLQTPRQQGRAHAVRVQRQTHHAGASPN